MQYIVNNDILPEHKKERSTHVYVLIWQIYQTWGLAASGSRSRDLKRSYPACPKNKKNPSPSILYYNIHLL